MGRGIKSSARRLLALPLAVVMMLGVSSPVLAVDPAVPNDFTIDSVQVVQNVAVDGDVLVSFAYTIHYDVDQPTTPANKLFHFRLMDEDGVTQLGAVEPYAYNNSGYDKGYSAFYFDPLSAPDWEAELVLLMAGNPQYWETPPEVNYTLVLTDYSQVTSKSENQQIIGNWVIDVSATLEVDWSVKLLMEIPQGTILNDTGAAYGKGTIPGLQILAPQIFTTKQVGINTDRRDWGEDITLEWLEQWEGTIIGSALEGLADLFSTSWLILTSVITLILVVLIFVWGYVWYQDNQAAMIGGSHVLVGSTVLGFFPFAGLALITLAAALYAGWIFIGDRS